MEYEGGAESQSNWSSFGATPSIEEADFVARAMGDHYHEQDREARSPMPSIFWPNHDHDHNFSSTDLINYNTYNWPQVKSSAGSSSSSSSFLFSDPYYQNYYLGDANLVPMINNTSASLAEFYAREDRITSSLPQFPFDHQFENPVLMNEEAEDGETGASVEEQMSGDSFLDQIMPRESKSHRIDDENCMKNGADERCAAIPTKKARAALSEPRRAKDLKPKKAKKSVCRNNEEESNEEKNEQSSSSGCSEDDSTASEEPNVEANPTTGPTNSSPPNPSGKTRAARGSATDPQSLYARRRREKINERLRILQNLVPNGTKVDISTMLEEAVRYVKFLQLQIKLLSSDEWWMYAPIAYNGVNIGLDLKIPHPQQ